MPTTASPPYPATEGTIDLADGRQLGYAEYGPSTGDPLLLFHGTPGSRYTVVGEPSLFEEYGIRQIVLERPGFGNSTFDPEREILDWPADVREATDALGIDQFYLLGGSGGAPFVLACAARMPDRLLDVGVIAGLGPLDAPKATEGMTVTYRLAWKAVALPFVSWPFLWVMIQMIRIRPGHHGMQEGVRQGPKGPLYENRLHIQPWGFELSSIPIHVHLWHGEQDTFTPLSMAESVAETIPSSTLYTYPDAGHYFPDEYDEEFISTLCNE